MMGHEGDVLVSLVACPAKFRESAGLMLLPIWIIKVLVEKDDRSRNYHIIQVRKNGLG